MSRRRLKRTDCSLVSDGAAALVLTDEDTARAMAKAVRFRAAVQVNDYLPISARDITRFEGAAEAWKRALDAAGRSLNDLSFVESHDCFTIAELLEYEAMGLTPAGQGARAVLEGWTAKDGQAAGQPLRRAEGQGPPDRRHRGVHARDFGDAAHRPGRRHAAAEGRPRRRVQHGRRGGGELRLDPGGGALIPTPNLACLLDQTAARFPDRPAVIWRGQTVTWAVFAARVRAAAAGLVARGVAPGDRVLLHARNSIALLETMWATWLAGAVWVPTNFRLTPPEVAYLASSSAAAVHIFDPAFPDHAAAARAANPAVRLELWLGEAADGLAWDTLADADTAPDRPVEVGHDHPAWFFYTSGTTGRPKAAVLTHGQLHFVVNNHLADLIPGTTEHDASLVVAPLSHGAGVHALIQVPRGAASVLLSGERLDCAEAWALVERHRITNMFTVPTILTMLARHEAVDRHDHSSLRYVIYAGAPMYRADQRFALEKLGKVLVQYYGMGEVTGAITVLPPAWHSTDDAAMAVGSCGFPRTGMEVAILGPDGTPLAAGRDRARSACAARRCTPATGTIRRRTRPPSPAAGSTPAISATPTRAASSTSPAGPRTCTSPADRTSIRARSRKCCWRIRRSPRPAWSAWRTRNGARPGWRCWCSAPTSTEADLFGHLEGRLAKYKYPARFAFWPELPKSGYGKVTKREVRRLLEDTQ